MKIVFGVRRLGLACLGLVTAAGLNVMVAEPAGATIIDTFSITSDHCDGGCLPSGVTAAGTITVTDNGTGTLHYSVVLNSGFGIINTGGSGGLGASLGFNDDKSPITVSNINTNSSFTFSLISPSTGTVHIDGFGSFDYGLNCTNCGNGATNPDFSPLSFDVTAAGGLFLTPSPTGDVTQSTGGAPNAYFAVDVYSTATGRTGPMDASVVSTNTPIPEPASLALLGMALAGLWLIGFRRRRRNEV